MRLSLTSGTALARSLVLTAAIGCSKSAAGNEGSHGNQNGGSSGPQEIDSGPKNSVLFTAVKAEARAPVVFNSEPEFQIRLNSGGTVEISESDPVTGEPNFQKRGLQFMALDTLELKKWARIVTGGNGLVIYTFTASLLPLDWHLPNRYCREHFKRKSLLPLGPPLIESLSRASR
jgi:hypothetical protein